MHAFILNNSSLYLRVYVRGPFAETQLFLAPSQAARLAVIAGRKGLIAFDVTTNQLAVLRPINVTANNQIFLVAGGAIGGPTVVVNPGVPVIREAEAAEGDNSGGLIQIFDDIADNS